MTLTIKKVAVRALGNFPLAPQLVYRIRQKRGTFGRYNLEQLRAALPQAVPQAAYAAQRMPHGKRIVLLASIHYWVEYCTMLGLTLAGQGHQVSMGFLPYADYRRREEPFELRYQSFYTHQVLQSTRSLLQTVDLLKIRPEVNLPASLQEAAQRIAVYDTQYVLQVEQVDLSSDFYRMRLEYNLRAARVLLPWLRSEMPEAFIFPNGIVIEYGMAYQVARFLDIPIVTYEFSEDREQIWIAHNDEVMRQDTGLLWKTHGDTPLTSTQRTRIEALERARQSARTFGKSDRLWQDLPLQGSQAIRNSLSLDERPVILLATNVLGDSLILGRNIFSQSMAEWIVRTIHFFSSRTDAQLVIRIHPGERYMKGPSMVDVVSKEVPRLPENVRIVGPLDKINTYDIMDIARLGLVYTTTTGMEMVMNGTSVIVAGDTHYRGKGFTLEPASWDEYFGLIEDAIRTPEAYRPTQKQIDLAWNYAYRFFFEYPRPFPWKIYDFWLDFQRWPLQRVFSEEGRNQFAASFSALVGEPIEWTDWDVD